MGTLSGSRVTDNGISEQRAEVSQRYIKYLKQTPEERNASKTHYTYAFSSSYIRELMPPQQWGKWEVPNMSRRTYAVARNVVTQPKILRWEAPFMPFAPNRRLDSSTNEMKAPIERITPRDTRQVVTLRRALYPQLTKKVYHIREIVSTRVTVPRKGIIYALECVVLVLVVYFLLILWYCWKLSKCPNV